MKTSPCGCSIFFSHIFLSRHSFGTGFGVRRAMADARRGSPEPKDRADRSLADAERRPSVQPRAMAGKPCLKRVVGLFILQRVDDFLPLLHNETIAVRSCRTSGYGGPSLTVDHPLFWQKCCKTRWRPRMKHGKKSVFACVFHPWLRPPISDLWLAFPLAGSRSACPISPVVPPGQIDWKCGTK